MTEKKIVIIDGNSLLNRAYYGLPLLTTKEGIYTNAVYGFVNMLYKILENDKPDYITVTFDRKAPTFRHLAFDEYKAGRKKMPKELAEQMPIVKEFLDIFGIHRIEIDGFEADDLIGTLVKYCEDRNVNPIVVTGDRDALQLASKNTKIFITKKGISSLEVYDDGAVYEKYQVTPKQFIDLKGLMGDPSDNIPGVPGIGEKTGIKLIKEFGSIENLLSNLEKISNVKLRNKLEEYSQQAVLSKKLATIMVDVPVELSLEEMKRTDPNPKELMALYSKLEFHSLMSKIKKGTSSLDEDQEDCKTLMISTADEIQEIKDVMIRQQQVYLKVFTDGMDIRDNRIVGISLLVDPDHSYFINLDNNDVGIYQLKDIFENPEIKKHGHQTKKDILALKKYDISLEGLSFDSAIAMYLIEPTRTSYEINDLAIQYLNSMISSEEELLGKGKKKIDYANVPLEKLAGYGHQYCLTVKGLREIFLSQLGHYDLEKLYYDVELPLIEVLADMEYQGFMVDRGMLDELGIKFQDRINQLTLEIYEYAGEEFNINSTKQLGVILFDKLGLPPIKKTKTGYSTNIEVLEKLQNKNPIITKIIDYRHMVKLKSTYIDGLIGVINKKTKKIHSSFNQTVTATGRISSTEPNLQNIPVKLEAGREIRKVFVPSGEDYLLLDADYSQIELRVLAHISKDENMIEAFRMEQDIHTATASKVFDVPVQQVTTLQRSRAKAVNFGIVYGISDYGLSENLHITKKEAQNYIDEYLNKYHGVKQYMTDIVKQGKEKGYVTTLCNRIRMIPELHATNFNLRSFGERTAMNTPVQGSAADIIKIAMVRVYAALKNRKMKSRLILQVHDELIVEVHKDEIEQVKEILRDKMEHAMILDVPLNVDMNLGKNWYDAK